MPQPIACDGALCQCAAGSSPAALTVTCQPIYKIGGSLAATIMDMTPGANVKPFGTCSILTAAAQGVTTPCVPAPVAPWTPGSMIQKVYGLPLLLLSAKLQCGIGGAISIVEPRNMIEVSD